MRDRDKSESLQVADGLESKRGGSQPRSTSRGSSTGSRVTKYTNNSLPYSLGVDKSWRNVFCHTLFEYIGTADDPWSVTEDYVRAVWCVVYPDLPFPVEDDDIGATVTIVSKQS